VSVMHDHTEDVIGGGSDPIGLIDKSDISCRIPAWPRDNST
jgi:hypothetical protein